MVRKGMMCALFVSIISLGWVSVARAQFPAGCGSGGYSMGIMVKNISQEGSNAARIGDQLVATLVVRPNLGSCAIEGGQVAALDPAGRFIEVAGFASTVASVSLIYNDNGFIFPEENGLVIDTPPMQVRCEDVPSVDNLNLSGSVGFATLFAGVWLEQPLYYALANPYHGGPGGTFNWAMAVDQASYLETCTPTIAAPEPTPIPTRTKKFSIKRGRLPRLGR